MSTIDEIMIAAMDYADERVMVVHSRSTQGGVHRAVCALRDMITAAIAEARREGAEAMRAEVWIPIDSAPKDGTVIQLFNSASKLRDIGHWYTPLQGGERQAVRLTDEQVAAVVALHWGRADIAPQSVRGFALSIESAVLAANNLEVRR